jgi:hypothetical protein
MVTARVCIAAFLLALIVRVPEAPATVAEQRARLPPPAECESPIEGKWKAIVFSSNDFSWYEFILEVRHVPENKAQLTGMIYVDTWLGGPEQSEPGPCNGRRYKGKMAGSGNFADGQVAFGGGDFQLVEILCGDSATSVGYNPDQFTGRIEPERQEFQSVNNDGGNAVNEPTVFRRIACFDDEVIAKPEGDVKPPPFFPARKSNGC